MFVSVTTGRGRSGVRLRAALRDTFRLLTFRSSREELAALDGSHLIVGLVATLLVGVGRYWHAPHASSLQGAGVASLIYLAALSVFLWLLYLPLRPEAWSIRRTLTFLSLVSLPGVLQAIPVREFADYWEALRLGAWVLGVVTIWRVALLLWFLVRSAGLRPLEAVISVLLPIDLILLALAYFQVGHEISDFVNGFRAFDILASMAFLALPLPLLGYAAVVVVRFVARRRRVG
jgi:hypothetical protein